MSQSFIRIRTTGPSSASVLFPGRPTENQAKFHPGGPQIINTGTVGVQIIGVAALEGQIPGANGNNKFEASGDAKQGRTLIDHRSVTFTYKLHIGTQIKDHGSLPYRNTYFGHKRHLKITVSQTSKFFVTPRQATVIYFCHQAQVFFSEKNKTSAEIGSAKIFTGITIYNIGRGQRITASGTPLRIRFKIILCQQGAGNQKTKNKKQGAL